MARCKDRNWDVGATEDRAYGMQSALLATLMDLRDELKEIRRLVACPNVSGGLVAMRNVARTVTRLDRRLAKKVRLP